MPSQRRSHPYRLIGWTAIWSVCAVLLLGSGATAADAVSRGLGAKGVSLPLFGADKSAPAATVHLDVLEVGADLRGFFRVALFPLVVGKEVEIRFRTPTPKALGDFVPAFRALAHADAIELQGCKIYLPLATAPALEVRHIRIQGEDEWQLQDATLASGEHFAKARLAVRGADAGYLITEGAGPHRRIALFPSP